MSILIYAFSNHWGTNISHRTLLELEKMIPNVDFQLITWHPQSFFRKHIEFNNYSLIIGLGDGLRNLSKIKIETQAKNAYNDKEIYPFSPILLDLSMPAVDNYDSNFFQIGSNIGTHNCNWIAYRTQLHLNQKNLDTKHLFLHLPPHFNATLAATKIFDLLKDNQIT